MKKILSLILCLCLAAGMWLAAAAEEQVGSNAFLLKIRDESGLEITYLRFDVYVKEGDSEYYAGFACSCPNEGEDFYRFEYEAADAEELKNLRIEVSSVKSELPPEEAILRAMSEQPENGQHLLTLDFVPEGGKVYDLKLVPGEGDTWILASADVPRATVRYEGVFMDNDEVKAMLEGIRGEQPYPEMTRNYHITTVFAPEEPATDLYGKEVEVRVIGSKACEVADEEGILSSNEGLKVVLHSDDPAMAGYLAGIDKNFHMTGSYTVAARNTEYIDFSDMEPVDYTIKGTFGANLTGIGVSFDPADIGKPLEETAEGTGK